MHISWIYIRRPPTPTKPNTHPNQKQSPSKSQPQSQPHRYPQPRQPIIGLICMCICLCIRIRSDIIGPLFFQVGDCFARGQCRGGRREQRASGIGRVPGYVPGVVEVEDWCGARRRGDGCLALAGF
jgi:hypothetical protein